MIIIKVDLPDYNIDSKPDYDKLGIIVDREIVKSFPDGKYVIRAVGSSDHPGMTRTQLIQRIVQLGTDKYDPKRVAIAHDQFQNYDYDIQAGTFEIKDSKIVSGPDEEEIKTEFGTTIYNYYEHTPLDRGYAIRIDLLLIYDPNKLELASKKNTDSNRFKQGLEQYLYKFKEPNNKSASLLGIVEIT